MKRLTATTVLCLLLFSAAFVTGKGPSAAPEYPDSLRSVWLYLAGGFLALYYAVWLRYFAGGRKTELLRRAFLLVPLPLAVFPVLYYLCAAIWLHNVPAVIIMLIFGAAHITVSLQSFRKEENR